jgi:hypothetical protein
VSKSKKINAKKLKKSCQKVVKKVVKKLYKVDKNSGSKAFGISFADRPKATATI